MKGKILSNIGDNFTLIGEDNVLYNVMCKGILRFKNNHLLVGDNVDFDETNMIITNLLPRKNELIRPRISNIDQLAIIMSVKEPDVSPYLLYKYLAYANYHQLSCFIIFSKVDNLSDKQKIDKLCTELNLIGIKALLHSENKKDINLSKLFENKVTALMGQTGAGKSSLINDLDPTFERSVGEYSVCLGRGKHMTKEVILLPYFGGYIADTPGFSSLELDFYKQDLAKCFPGFNVFDACYYKDCLHLSEPQCSIKIALQNGTISQEQYDIYLKLINELKDKKEKY